MPEITAFLAFAQHRVSPILLQFPMECLMLVTALSAEISRSEYLVNKSKLTYRTVKHLYRV